MEKPHDVAFCAFGIRQDVVGFLAGNPEDELEVPAHEAIGEKLGVYQMSQVVNRHDELSTVKQRNVAVGNMQDIRLPFSQGTVGKRQLFLVAVDRTVERQEFDTAFFAKREIFPLAQNDGIVSTRQPFPNARADSGTVDHSRVDSQFHKIRFFLRQRLRTVFDNAE